MSQYFISHEASQDLDEILDYFLSHNVEAGERLGMISSLSELSVAIEI